MPNSKNLYAVSFIISFKIIIPFAPGISCSAAGNGYFRLFYLPAISNLIKPFVKIAARRLKKKENSIVFMCEK